MKVEPRTLKGFRDFLPNDARKRAYVLNILKEVFESYGFEPLETPALEYDDILSGKYGEEGDKLMYKFTDNGERRVAMRYDQTVPLARVVAQYQNDLPLPFKRYQIQNVYRAENTQKGRFREFLQVDIDTVGSTSLLADAEIIALIADGYKKLGFKNFKILLNDRQTFADMKKDGIITDENLPRMIRAIDKLKKIGREGVLDELIGIGFESDYSNYILQKFDSTSPTNNILEIINTAEKLGVEREKIKFLPTLARGLDYYTGIIIEVEVDGYDVGSVGGGGRYDNLIGMFSNSQIPAVGFAFGFDRVMEAMTELGLFPTDLEEAKVLVTNTSERSTQIANDLRNNGIRTELYVDEKDLDKQLKYADKKQIPYVLIVEQTLTLKNMKTGEKKEVTLDQLSDAIR